MTRRSDDEEPILSRTFERDDGEVALRFFAPVSDPNPRFDANPDDPPWRCRFAITFPDGEVRRNYAVGIDSVQALLLAFALAQGDLYYVGNGTCARRPSIRWLGEDDLGLTVNHFDFDQPGPASAGQLKEEQCPPPPTTY